MRPRSWLVGLAAAFVLAGGPGVSAAAKPRSRSVPSTEHAASSHGAGTMSRPTVGERRAARRAAVIAERPDPEARYRRCDRRRHWWCCPPGTSPCIRSGAARLALLGVAALAGASAAGILFAIGDRLGGGDPATLAVGTGALAGVGALTGVVVSRLSRDSPGDPDRIRPTTIGLDYAFGRPANLDETNPHTMAVRIAPTYTFPDDGGRLRLIGHFGGRLWTAREVDPRPQNNTPIEGQEGTHPVVHRERSFAASIGLDLAVSLPYPVLAPRRSAYLGPAEIRYRPEFQIRREIFDPGGENERILERTMLLPLNVGMRWILSARQRFTFYIGPRFDIISFSNPGSSDLRRGSAQVAAMYGEAWYDIDFPFTLWPRMPPRLRKTVANGMLSLGYVHSRFDGQGLNVGPVVGFLGPIRVAWHTRVRPRSWPVALQGSVDAAIGSGYSVTVHVGVVLPDLKASKKAKERK